MAFDQLNVCLLEHQIADGDKEKNLSHVADSIKTVPPGIDLYTLPELFTTGFISNAERAHALSEKNTEQTIDFLHEVSEQHNCAIAGSYLSHTAGRVYNRAFFIGPSGDETFYDKRHLFSMGGEKDVFSDGLKPSPIIRFRGWNIKPIVCYDLRFPVFCRNRNNEYDVLLVIANWPVARQKVWQSLLVARAIENECYVCGVNRGGTDATGVEYGVGSSIVVDYKGEIIARTSQSSPMAYAKLSREKLDNLRKKFPVWKDADDFAIK